MIPEWLGDDAATVVTLLAIPGAIVAAVIGFRRAWAGIRRALKVEARAATDELLATLMRPNGGKSLADISAKITSLTEHRAEDSRRLDRMEHQIDGILIPHQRDIQRAVNAANRAGDEE